MFFTRHLGQLERSFGQIIRRNPEEASNTLTFFMGVLAAVDFAVIHPNRDALDRWTDIPLWGVATAASFVFPGRVHHKLIAMLSGFTAGIIICALGSVAYRNWMQSDPIFSTSTRPSIRPAI